MKSESSDVVFEMVRSVLTEFNDGVVGSDSQLRLLWGDIYIVFLNLMIWEIVKNWGWRSCENESQRWFEGKIEFEQIDWKGDGGLYEKEWKKKKKKKRRMRRMKEVTSSEGSSEGNAELWYLSFNKSHFEILFESHRIVIHTINFNFWKLHIQRLFTNNHPNFLSSFSESIYAFSDTTNLLMKKSWASKSKNWIDWNKKEMLLPKIMTVRTCGAEPNYFFHVVQRNA